MIGHVQLSLLIVGGDPPGIDNYRAFNYLSDFAENWLKGLYMYQDDTRAIISQSDHSFNMIKNPNALYMSIVGWDLIGPIWKS